MSRQNKSLFLFCLFDTSLFTTRSMMLGIEHYGVNTVENKNEFLDNVLIKDCPIVGRSLVTKKPLSPGSIVLIEKPLISYPLRPNCRSSKSPYYSKRVWNTIVSYIQDEAQKASGADTAPDNVHIDHHQDSDDSDYYDDDSDEEEEEETITPDESDFSPGVPAAILAYLEINPPPSYQVRHRKSFQSSEFDFFYYPDTSKDPEWLNHQTIRLIESVCSKVIKNIPLFAHLDQRQLSSFVLKIYSNAHTVSLPSARTEPTHSKKRGRQLMYEAKFKDRTTYWGNDTMQEKPSTPTIALMLWGSKFAHSCSPNMFLRYEPSSGTMVFTVTRSLKAGEVLSFSYLPEDSMTLGGLVCGSVIQRRAKLEKFKFFKCTCERCMDWDWSRGTLCNGCGVYDYYRNHNGVWSCFSCGHTSDNEEEIQFIGEYENTVERMVMNFNAKLNGGSVSESTMRMLEPYLNSLLTPPEDKQVDPVPVNHWTYGIIKSLLAIYHLSLFPKSFGKGLAIQLGLIEQGLEEAACYLEYLDKTIRTHSKAESTSPGNPMAAFFAGWRVLSVVIDLVMDSTQDKYANQVYERDDSSDSENETENKVKVKKVVKQEKPIEITLIPLSSEWVPPLKRISTIVNGEWTLLAKKVFASHNAIVIDDMIQQIELFLQRLKETTK
ncbi:hypothetical protein BDB01DRAFT_775430 [Pilobolus umbonatus]|nr:hypothetical protein BDB01DRAFT_775430 [Pilobolus umbonatus]